MEINKYISFCLIVLLLQGCMSSVAKKNIPQLELKKEKQVKNITKHNDTLRCMDNLYEKLQEDINSENKTIIYVDGVKNETANKEKIPDSIETMLITSLNKLGNHIVITTNSEETGAYHLKPAITEFDYLQGSGASLNMGFSVGKGGGETDTDSSGGYREKIFNMAIDFNVINGTSYEPYVSTSYKMKIIDVKDSNDFAISIYGNGFGMSANISKSQGIHEAIRFLIEISLAELFGELDLIPYWKCSGGKKDIEFEDRMRFKYRHYQRTGELEGIIKFFLKKWNILDTSDNLEESILKYKKMNNVFPIDEEITLELFSSLLTTIPILSKDNTRQSIDLFRKYVNLNDIKLFSNALNGNSSFHEEDQFEQNKKLDSIYRLFQKEIIKDSEKRLLIDYVVSQNKSFNEAEKDSSYLIDQLIRRGISKKKIIKKIKRSSINCNTSNNKRECNFNNNYANFQIR